MNKMEVQYLKGVASTLIILLLVSCSNTDKECLPPKLEKYNSTNDINPLAANSTNNSSKEWWQLHIEGDDTTVHPYKHIVVIDDSIFYFDDMEDDMRSIDNIRTEGDKRIFEFKDRYQTTHSFICHNPNDSESLWSLPAHWDDGVTYLYTINKSRYKTYNFGIDTIYQYIGIEKVDSKWHGLYELVKTICIDDPELKDTFDRYFRVFIDSAVFVYQDRHPYYTNNYALYVFSENDNQLLFTQGFNDGVPKDTCLELLFDGDDYYVKCYCYDYEDEPSLTQYVKMEVNKKYISFLRKEFEYKYAKKIPHRNGVYLELPFIETEDDDD